MKPLSLLLVLVPAALFAAPSVTLELVAGGLTQPVAITHAGDGRLFITQQHGVIAIHDGTTLLPEPFLDLRHRVITGGERGLLSAAFHPHYATNGLFYVNYTETGTGATVVERYSVSPANPDRADPLSATEVLRIPQPFGNHNGGQLQFGPDGFLYIGTGDGGSGGDPGNRAQNLNDLLGKMLRIDVDGGPPYAVPPSNPFVGHAGRRPEIWASGLRNPWRFSFDRAAGDLWIADVGQGLWEEVNVQRATSIGGENYGWRLMEGMRCFNPATGCNDGSLTLPVIEYGHTGGACAVTGGYAYRGARFRRLHGLYIYGDYCTGVIWGASLGANGQATSQVLHDAPFPISTFGEDVNGELFVADHAGGRIFKLIDNAPMPPRRRSVRH